MYYQQQHVSLLEKYRKELHRIAWKIQYKAKVQSNREITSDEIFLPVNSFSLDSDNKLFISQLIDSLPSDIGKDIIYELYINDKTELQVAKKHHMSQQAVSKWKRKMLRKMYQMLSSKGY